jgi:uncharacterized membrane protein
MLETIGFIVWILITLVLTSVPFLIGCLAGLGGGFGRVDKVVSCLFVCIAAISWYFIFASFSVSIN